MRPEESQWYGLSLSTFSHAVTAVAAAAAVVVVALNTNVSVDGAVIMTTAIARDLVVNLLIC